MPWNIYLGVGVRGGCAEPHVEVKRVEVSRPAFASGPSQPRFIQVTVVEKGSGTPVPEALVRYDGRNLTGMITTADGTFRSGDLEPGTYTFNVSATGYRDGQCSATIAAAGQAGQPSPYGAGPPAPAYGAGPPASLRTARSARAAPNTPPGPYGAPTSSTQPYGPGPYAVPPGTAVPPGAAPMPGAPAQPGLVPGMPSAVVTCELEAQAKVGNVNGQLRDAESSAAVGGASIKITDNLGRSLSLNADGAGSFRFENVPPGRSPSNPTHPDIYAA